MSSQVASDMDVFKFLPEKARKDYVEQCLNKILFEVDILTKSSERIANDKESFIWGVSVHCKHELADGFEMFTESLNIVDHEIALHESQAEEALKYANEKIKDSDAVVALFEIFENVLVHIANLKAFADTIARGEKIITETIAYMKRNIARFGQPVPASNDGEDTEDKDTAARLYAKECRNFFSLMDIELETERIEYEALAAQIEEIEKVDGPSKTFEECRDAYESVVEPFHDMIKFIEGELKPAVDGLVRVNGFSNSFWPSYGSHKFDEVYFGLYERAEERDELKKKIIKHGNGSKRSKE